MRQAGRYLPEYMLLRKKFGGFLDLCYNSDGITDATLQPLQRFDLDAAIIFSDILVVLDAIGFEVNFYESFGPKVAHELIGDLTHSSILKLSHNFNKPRFQEIYSGIKKTKESIKPFGEKTLIGFVGAPWTLACYAIESSSSKDFNKVKNFSYNKPNEFSCLIEVIKKACIEHIEGQIKAGVDAIQIFDSWANVLDWDDWHKWVLKPFLEISSAIKAKYQNIPIIWFPRASFGHYAHVLKNDSKILENILDCFSVEHGVTLEFLLEFFPKNMTLQGNLDPTIFTVDNFDSVSHKVKKTLSILRNTPRIINLGHGILPNSRIDNIKKTIDMVREFDCSLYEKNN